MNIKNLTRLLIVGILLTGAAKYSHLGKLFNKGTEQKVGEAFAPLPAERELSFEEYTQKTDQLIRDVEMGFK